MMLKQTLLALAILAVSGTAAATDVTNPFYLPYQKQVGLITSTAFKRLVEKNKAVNTKSHQLLVKEDVQLGLTDSVALVGAVGNTWDRWRRTRRFPTLATQKERDNENIQWDAGLAWNILQGPTRLQVAAKYGQNRLENFDGEYKYALGEAKLGYQFERALPYITGSVEIPVGQKSGIKGIAGDKFIYNTKAGIYQGACEVWALDTGVRLTYDENREARLITAEAEASYYLTPSITVGVYGTYTLDGRSKYDMDIYEKSAGARLRLFF